MVELQQSPLRDLGAIYAVIKVAHWYAAQESDTTMLPQELMLVQSTMNH